MTSNPKPQENARSAISVDKRSGQDVLRGLRTNEVFVAIVGPAGSGSGTAAKILKAFLEENDFEVEIVKASVLSLTLPTCFREFHRARSERGVPG
ncbi:hypothetical protein ROE7235_03658 [Roseibaca ekhonensis]|uniref:Uncharacterized protein n=1 Tax=Roseinatronobacter ekhonensis TaxID=254356 RepID=A0A3B0ME48_9RHOB|nr:hypothetical protein ROE7235_03658 [Roseibaca ekhonensis]